MSQNLVNKTLSARQLTRNDSDFIAFSRIEPKKKDEPEVVFLPGLRSDQQGTKALHLADFCEAKGLGYTRFDYYGHGESSGKFTDGTIGKWLEDTLAIIDEVAQGPLILVGSSLGGWLMALAAMERPERIKGLVGLAVAPDFTEELMWASFSQQQQEELMCHGHTFIPSDYEGGAYEISQNLIMEGRNHLILRRDLPITCPIHLLHGTHDRDVPVKISERFMTRVASEDVALTLIKGGDHSLSKPRQLELLTHTIENMCQKIKSGN